MYLRGNALLGPSNELVRKLLNTSSVYLFIYFVPYTTLFVLFLHVSFLQMFTYLNFLIPEKIINR